VESEFQADARPGLVGRMAGVFTAPERTFDSLRQGVRTIDWLVPTLLVIAVAAGSALVTMPQLQALQAEMLQARLKNLPAEQQAAAARMPNGGALATVGMLMSVSVGSFLSLLVIAGLLLLVARVGLGASVGYAQMLAVDAYASLVSVVAMVVKTPLVLAKDDYRVYTGLGLLLSEEQLHTFFGRFVAGFDLFWLWQLWVVAVGVATLAGTDIRRALVPLVVLWFLWLALAAWLGGLFQP
jgi:hypothetical protein